MLGGFDLTTAIEWLLSVGQLETKKAA